MIEKILFPVDFSPACAAMAAYVGRAAAIFRARVALLHVANLASRNGFEIPVRPAPEIEEENRGLAQERLNAFLQAEFPSSKSERFLAFGDVADEITKMANRDAFDLVVMPTHAGRFRRMLLGSTTAKVLVDAGCPVLTSEHAETITPKPLENRNWLCALSLNDDSERVLRIASEAAKVAGAQLSLIHAIQVSRIGLAREDDSGLFETREAQRRVEQLQQVVGSSTPFQITDGPSVKEALIKAAWRLGTDMLIIGRKGQHDLAYPIVRDSPVPVLSI